MKKLLSLTLAIALILLALPTAAFAATNPADLSKLLTGTMEGKAEVFNWDYICNDGIYFYSSSGEPITDMLTPSTLNGLPAFAYNGRSGTSYWAVAFDDTQKDKHIAILKNDGDGWEFLAPSIVGGDTVHKVKYSLQKDSKIVGYTTPVNPIKTGANSLYLLVGAPDENDVIPVYPFVFATSEANSPCAPKWNDAWPKTDEELTASIQANFEKAYNITYIIPPTFSSGGKRTKSHKNLLYLPITATAGEGGSITEPGQKIFRPGSISQKYTVTANEGYTIYYIQVDGKAVPNSINCGDTATFTFDAIYGPRSINAVFKKK
ncbi:MAG: hypothetical protein PHY23_03460 [Oscillospiraceae bacterium]|nr:hypothetical protein [Oscillospiraceae bacterium]WMJ83363.1 hypothetical protein RBH76_11585 [Oscillospiraceae bacterium MB24-C1]